MKIVEDRVVVAFGSAEELEGHSEVRPFAAKRYWMEDRVASGDWRDSDSTWSWRRQAAGIGEGEWTGVRFAKETARMEGDGDYSEDRLSGPVLPVVVRSVDQ